MLPKDRNYDKKIFRIWTILNKLDTRRRISSRELAGEFNVSIRTVQRDIELLTMAGFPIYTPEKGFYTFAGKFSLKRVELSEEEASLLSFLYEMAKSLGEDFEDSFRGLFKKVLSRETDSPFYIKVPEGVKLNKEFPFIRKLKNAIEEGKKVELDYQKKQDETKIMRVDPLKISFFDGFWYLLSRVDTKDWLVKLRLDKMSNIKILEEFFDAPANLKTLLEESVNIWFSETRDKKIVLKIQKDAAPYFKKNKYFPLQKITKENKDGSLTLESKVSNHMEVLPNILRWIPSIKVVEPGELKDEIDNRIQKYLNK